METNPEKIKYRYFSSVQGHIVPRFGAQGQYIGAKLIPSGEEVARSLLGPSGQGSFLWGWDTTKVVRISEKEFVLYGREYTRALKSGALVQRTAKDYDKYIKGVADTDNAAPDDDKPGKRGASKEQTS